MKSAQAANVSTSVWSRMGKVGTACVTLCVGRDLFIWHCSKQTDLTSPDLDEYRRAPKMKHYRPRDMFQSARWRNLDMFRDMFVQ